MPDLNRAENVGTIVKDHGEKILISLSDDDHKLIEVDQSFGRFEKRKNS